MADAMPDPEPLTDTITAAPGEADSTADSDGTAESGGSKATATLALVGVAGLLASLTQSLLVPVLPQLAVDLHASTSSIEWLLTATLLVGAVAVPVFGRLGDLYGKKRMLVITQAILVVGSLICAFTSNIGVMIAGRAVVGLSMAAIPVGISLSPRSCRRSGPAPASR